MCKKNKATWQVGVFHYFLCDECKLKHATMLLSTLLWTEKILYKRIENETSDQEF